MKKKLSWWNQTGLFALNVYVHVFLLCLFATCKCAVFTIIQVQLHAQCTVLFSLFTPSKFVFVKVFHCFQGDAELFLGYMDTTFLFCYAVGLYLSGIIGDR